jgi:hypothetical protein
MRINSFLTAVSMLSLSIVQCSCGMFYARHSVVEDNPTIAMQIAACSGRLSDIQERKLVIALSDAKKQGKIGTQLADVVESTINDLLKAVPEHDRKAVYEEYVKCLGLVASSDVNINIKNNSGQIIFNEPDGTNATLAAGVGVCSVLLWVGALSKQLNGSSTYSDALTCREDPSGCDLNDLNEKASKQWRDARLFAGAAVFTSVCDYFLWRSHLRSRQKGSSIQGTGMYLYPSERGLELIATVKF